MAVAVAVKMLLTWLRISRLTSFAVRCAFVVLAWGACAMIGATRAEVVSATMVSKLFMMCEFKLGWLIGQVIKGGGNSQDLTCVVGALFRFDVSGR